MINFLSNAILVKIRARYAKRLSQSDYKSLLSCESVSDIAHVLKNKPFYSGSISKMMNEEIHRGKLEEALTQSFLEDLSCLANYDLKFSKKIFRYILIRSEIKKISRFLIFLKSGKSKNFESFFPEFLRSKSKIDFSEFVKINTYDELVSVLGKSKYHKILKACNDNGQFDINVVETSLYNYLFDIIVSSIYGFEKKVINQTKNFLFKYVDLCNIVRIIRTKKIFNAPDDYISKIVFQFKDYRFNKYDLCDKNLSDIFGKEIVNISDLEKFSKMIRFKWAKRSIRYSNIPEVIAFSYILLREIEIMNVINIIEGVRYNLQREKIEGMLIK